MIESISTSLNALHKQFEEQVVSDNKKFQIQSIYLPNPTFTINPRTCLVAMEPSLGRMSSEEFQVWVNRGFKNFLLSEGDFILHYCAFHFLCNNSFDYQITDISKGAMTTKLANQQRKDRYSCWMDLLKLELEFLGKPKIIAVGSVTKNFLQDIGWQLQGSILHYSQNNSWRFRDYYEQHMNNSLPETLYREIRDFAAKIMNEANYNLEMQNSVVDKLFKKELPPWKKGMFLYYKDLFTQYKN